MSAGRAPRPRHVARWSAIGCSVHVETALARDLAPAAGAVRRVVADVDEVASRFREDSDLSRVNRAPGTWVRVDPLLVAAVRVAVDAARRTAGIVHPLLGRTMVELGYDTTFASLTPRPARRTAGPTPDGDAWRAIDLDAAWVRIPGETALDLGATAKAWITDLAVAALEELLDGPAVVAVGGDLRTVGETAWEVEVREHPRGEAGTAVRAVGALATSSTQVRRWTVGAEHLHHLVDPRTGRPAAGCWRTVTVAAPTCVAANTASTAAVVLGREAEGWLAASGVLAARLVGTDGRTRAVGRWPDEERTHP